MVIVNKVRKTKRAMAPKRHVVAKANWRHAIAMAENQGSASSGKLLRMASKKYAGNRMKRPEAPGPKYCGKNKGKFCTVPLARKGKACRIAYRTLAGMCPSDRVRVGVHLKLLPKMEKTPCPYQCGTVLRLVDVQRASQYPGLALPFGLKGSVPTACQYVCADGSCNGRKGVAVVSDKGALPSLGGKGRAPAGEGILMLCLACQPWSHKSSSPSDTCLIQGNSTWSTQLYLDEVRNLMARLNVAEQKKIQFTGCIIIDIDEAGIRAVRVLCEKNCLKCGSKCAGYRLEWNRWIMVIERGNRKRMIVAQLPFKTCAAGGGGIKLEDKECDDVLPQFLGKGPIVMTDGASPYEALASGDIRCSPACKRNDCLRRAKKSGQDACCGWRPRVGRARFAKHYRQKKLAHGIVCHDKMEWVTVKKVEVHNAAGRRRIVALKHGTEVVDGCWHDLKQAVPRQIASTDRDRIFKYVNAWAWMARRHGEDLFRALADGLKNLKS